MKTIALLFFMMAVCGRPRHCGQRMEPSSFSGEQKRRRSRLHVLEVASIVGRTPRLDSDRPHDGSVSFSAESPGSGTGDHTFSTIQTKQHRQSSIIERRNTNRPRASVTSNKGNTTVRVACEGAARVERLVVKAIPDLIHSGLGFDPAIKAFGHYDMDFSQNRTSYPTPRRCLCRPPHEALPQSVVDDWHRQGKRFVVGGRHRRQRQDGRGARRLLGRILLDSARFADGIIVDEFIINRPIAAE